MDGWFTGADFPHFAVAQLSTAVRRRCLGVKPRGVFFCGGLIKTQQIHNGFCFEFRQVQGMVLSSSCPLAVPVIFHYIHKSYSFKQQSFTFLCKKGVLKSAKCLTSCCNVNRGSLHRIFQIAASSRTSPALWSLILRSLLKLSWCLVFILQNIFCFMKPHSTPGIKDFGFKILGSSRWFVFFWISLTQECSTKSQTSQRSFCLSSLGDASPPCDHVV